MTAQARGSLIHSRSGTTPPRRVVHPRAAHAPLVNDRKASAITPSTPSGLSPQDLRDGHSVHVVVIDQRPTIDHHR